MGTKTGIQWTDATWITITGCDRVSPGCAHCYAVGGSFRMGLNPNPKINAVYGGTVERKANGVLDWTGEVKCHETRLDLPRRWANPKRIFVNSMADTFHERVPWEFLDAMFDVMEACPQHIFQLLTKRPGTMAAYVGTRLRQQGRTVLPAHIWCGTSVENQHWAKRLHSLIETPAQTRFISAEPLLGPVDFTPWFARDVPSPIQWVIVGGESGPAARPLDPAWIRSIVTQCDQYGVACFVKQLGSVWAEAQDAAGRTVHHKGGEPDEWPESLQVRQWPTSGILGAT